MRLIVDSNVLFSALIKDSITRRILMHIDAELITIAFSEQEMANHQKMLLQKSSLNKIEFGLLLEKLKSKLVFIDDLIVAARFEEAYEITKKIDPQDSPFVAAALATGSDIWSDDTHFDKQHKVKIWKTKDLVKFLK